MQVALLKTSLESVITMRYKTSHERITLRDERVVGRDGVVDAVGPQVCGAVFACEEPSQVYAGTADYVPGAAGVSEDDLPWHRRDFGSFGRVARPDGPAALAALLDAQEVRRPLRGVAHRRLHAAGHRAVSAKRGEEEVSPSTAGIIGILIMLAVFMTRMPVAYVMTLVGLGGFSYLISLDAGLNLLPRIFFDTFSEDVYLVSR